MYTIDLVAHGDKPRDRYLVEVQWMHGDADFYTTTEYVVNPEHIQYAIEAVQTLTRTTPRSEAMIVFFGDGLTRAEYDKQMQDDPTDFDVRDTENYEEYMNRLELDIEYDKECGYCGDYAKINAWRVKYFDGYGKEYGVRVKDADGKYITPYWSRS